MPEDENSKVPDSVRENPKNTAGFIKRYRRTIIAAILFLSAMLAFLVTRTEQKPLETEFMVALTAAMAVHLLDRLWLHTEAEETFDELQKNIVDKVGIKTQESIKTLTAMKRTGLQEVYANREEAAPYIQASLIDPRTDNIRIIGISLNDFFAAKDKDPLRQAWKVLKRSIENGVEPGRRLAVKVLIIDPKCLGAQLRSRGEERNGKSFLGRLEKQVDGELADLMELRSAAKHAGVSFECKLYRLPPILFLCWTSTYCYVQQYYFWASRDDEEKSFPVLKFQNTNNDSLHAELLKHFDWIWDKASITLDEYAIELSVGVDQGTVRSGIVNVFTAAAEGRARMLYLLKNAKHRVCIQGNSLHSFLNTRTEHTVLFGALRQLLLDDKVEIAILILDPQSPPAKFRGYRESSLKSSELRWTQYESSDEKHHDSILYKDTTDAERAMAELIQEVAKSKPVGWRPKLTGGKYDSSPYCFLLRVDDRVLVEQYHYGKLPEEGSDDSGKLGRDVPLVEYSASPSDIYDRTMRPPFELFVNHFAFALRDATPFDIDGWLAAVQHPAVLRAAAAAE